MRQGHNQYAPMIGVPELRAAIADKVRGQHGMQYDVQTEITVTSGATEALMSSLLALVHPGDEVILIDPAYDLYAPCIELAGALPIRVAMQPPGPEHPQFHMDWDAVEAAITQRTRMLVLNFPHNPTGIILNESDLDALEQILERHPILLLSDEAYEHIVFEGESHRSVVQRASLAPRSILVSSFGKTLHATGWRIGYCCAPAAIMREIRKVHQYTVFAVTTPIQHGIARYVRESDAVSSLGAFYQKKRDRLVSGLRTTPLVPLPAAGTFFLLVDTRALGPGPEKELAIRLTLEVGVTTIPVSAFYADPGDPGANHQLLRLCFAKQDATLDAALERLQNLRPGCAG
jgi:methionine aminotransferase